MFVGCEERERPANCTVYSKCLPHVHSLGWLGRLVTGGALLHDGITTGLFTLPFRCSQSLVYVMK